MSLTPAEELTLVQRAKMREEDAFEQLILSYSAPLYRVVSRMARDPQDAEGVVQEAFWRTWRALDRYQPDRSFFAYLVTVALNIQRDQWRAERWVDDRQEILETITNEKEGNPAAETEDREQQAILNDAIRQLPGIYRAVIALRYDAGMRYEQIAEALNLPVNTVRTHLHRAKRLLRKWLEEKNG
jgi:RNA polymerase sigma-70 factor (ECF subfamily)